MGGDVELQARIWMVLASLSGAMAVAAGAFGAHGATDPQAKAWLQTGAHYQLVHALAVFACFVLWRLGGGSAQIAAWLFLAGSLVFSGTLYLMAFGAPRILGAITPIGGVMLILAWIVLAWTAFVGERSTLV
jgi:uncharacterized membrane protein YgdD (TMEM256/DUF423 family)